MSADGAEPAVDIVFNDALTCYDAVADAWYSRDETGYPIELSNTWNHLLVQ